MTHSVRPSIAPKPVIIARRVAFVSFALLSAEAVTLHAQEKINFNDHVRAVLENKCFSCHNPDKKRGDLDLTSFAATMTGGGTGAIVIPGDHEGSKLITTTTKKAEPFMPPEGSPLTPQEVEILTKWINGGVLETASSIARKAAPKASIALTVSASGKPEGPVAMPEHVLLEPVVVAPRTSAITAIAASSWAPLVAISGQKQALIYNTDTRSLAGIYPYEEGQIRSLKFSQSGGLLVGAGGQGGRKGNVVVWDVKSGKRVAEVGNEFDQVMTADISPNQTMVALGGPSKAAKVYDLSTNEEVYAIKKHTEWIMSLAFSPDGVLLASADRNGGVVVSEASNGAEFYVLDTHKTACTSVAWRADSNILATSGEDGKIVTYEMTNGKVVKVWDAHAGGCLSVSFTPDGNVVSSGRDGVVRIWDVNGKKLMESPKQPDLVTKVAALHDSKTCVTGDWLGNTKMWSFAGVFAEVGALSSNPQPIAARISESEKLAAALMTQVGTAEAGVKKATDALNAKNAAVEAAKKLAGDMTAGVKKLEQEVAAANGQQQALTKSLAETNQRRAELGAEWKKHEAIAAKLKTDEASLAALTAERQTLTTPEQQPKAAEVDKKLADLKAPIEAAKAAMAKPPQQMIEVDGKIREIQEQLTALNKALPEKKKQLDELKPKAAKQPEVVAALEKEVAPLSAGLAAAQNQLKKVQGDLAFQQQMPVKLRAAQFNLGLLAERDALEKLEAEVKGLQEAQKETDATLVAAKTKIDESRKVMAESAAALPALDEVFAKLTADQPAIEKMVEPGKAQEGQLLGQVNAEKKKVVDQEAAIKALDDAKNARIAAAAKAAEEITKQIQVLQKQLGDVNGKLDGPAKAAEAKQVAMNKMNEDLQGARSLAGLANQRAQETQAVVKKSEEALAAAKGNAEAEKAATEALNAARKSMSEAQGALGQGNGLLAQREKAAAQSKAEHEAAVKAAAPLREQQANLNKQIGIRNQELAAKKAEPEKANAEFAAASQPHRVEIGKVKAVVGPMETQLAEVRAKLAADQKTVEGARAALAKAKGDAEAVRQRQADAQKSIDGATKQIADSEKMLVEIQQELAKQEPGLQPLRDKVKQLSEQYFAMLPPAK
ncbi:hypothetical protein FEM03_02285 [Phragmitibacter flavus]|uniref:Uncharacterized protein n=1 Tax=Phragmitibacter flavus TaxID=2576071 RepID=A0A5R8KJU2_9BACT|nr:c-type cytochrome domain-containing protein [Phragmitibacter flavus]TLD72205.1 hypothetical protein FEM03_02285 [Phragmitibacter flavus]